MLHSVDCQQLPVLKDKRSIHCQCIGNDQNLLALFVTGNVLSIEVWYFKAFYCFSSSSI